MNGNNNSKRICISKILVFISIFVISIMYTSNVKAITVNELGHYKDECFEDGKKYSEQPYIITLTVNHWSSFDSYIYKLWIFPEERKLDKNYNYYSIYSLMSSEKEQYIIKNCGVNNTFDYNKQIGNELEWNDEINTGMHFAKFNIIPEFNNYLEYVNTTLKNNYTQNDSIIIQSNFDVYDTEDKLLFKNSFKNESTEVNPEKIVIPGQPINSWIPFLYPKESFDNFIQDNYNLDPNTELMIIFYITINLILFKLLAKYTVKYIYKILSMIGVSKR